MEYRKMIKELLKYGLSRKDIARALGYKSPGYITQIHTGRRNLPEARQDFLAGLYNEIVGGAVLAVLIVEIEPGSFERERFDIHRSYMAKLTDEEIMEQMALTLSIQRHVTPYFFYGRVIRLKENPKDIRRMKKNRIQKFFNLRKDYEQLYDVYNVEYQRHDFLATVAMLVLDGMKDKAWDLLRDISVMTSDKWMAAELTNMIQGQGRRKKK